MEVGLIISMATTIGCWVILCWMLSKTIGQRNAHAKQLKGVTATMLAADAASQRTIATIQDQLSKSEAELAKALLNNQMKAEECDRLRKACTGYDQSSKECTRENDRLADLCKAKDESINAKHVEIERLQSTVLNREAHIRELEATVSGLRSKMYDARTALQE